jgi:hypothetical protein
LEVLFFFWKLSQQSFMIKVSDEAQIEWHKRFGIYVCFKTVLEGRKASSAKNLKPLVLKLKQLLIKGKGRNGNERMRWKENES